MQKVVIDSFNTQPPEGGWLENLGRDVMALRVSTHSRPKAAGSELLEERREMLVSTHSRPKAAGSDLLLCLYINGGFNTQPPEGGWSIVISYPFRIKSFNTQPPEGGWCLSQKPCSIRFRSPNFAKLLRKAQTRV